VRDGWRLVPARYVITRITSLHHVIAAAAAAAARTGIVHAVERDDDDSQSTRFLSAISACPADSHAWL